jgi:hypothetical protein
MGINLSSSRSNISKSIKQYIYHICNKTFDSVKILDLYRRLKYIHTDSKSGCTQSPAKAG